MPFVHLKCKADKKSEKNPALIWKDLPPVNMTGFGMIAGRVQAENSNRLLPTENLYGNAVPKVPFAIVAFFTGLIGFVFSLLFKGKSFAMVITATLSAICMVYVRFSFASNLDPGLHLQHAKITDMAEVRFTLWFYLSVISFLITALSGYLYGLFNLEDNYRLEYEPGL
jgi:hypothetical protein